MLRSLLLPLSTVSFAAVVLGSGVSFVACGDLVIPANSVGDDGGDDASNGGGDDGGAGSGDDGNVPVDARPPVDCDAGIDPVALSCTGLYANWTQLTLAPDVQAYTPGYAMWTDGASSLRYVWLPPGTKIDTTDMNDWVFPVGTKFWQEISLLGVRIETRYLNKVAAGVWFRATFAWTDDLSAAPALPAGLPNARGLPYDIPPVAQCEQCHNGASDFVLGFEDVSIGAPMAAGLNLTALKQQQLLTAPPSAIPLIPGPDTVTISALGFLHSNCGTSCHNRGSGAGAGQTGLFMKLLVDGTGALPTGEQLTDTWTTSYQVPSHFTPSGYDAGGFWRIEPGDVAHSMIPWRAGRRDGVTQMPPIATHLVDQNDVANLNAWVNELTPNGGGPVVDAGAPPVDASGVADSAAPGPNESGVEAGGEAGGD